jgi:hypothetical protein
MVWASDCPFVGHEHKFPYPATIDWLVDAIPDAARGIRSRGRTRAVCFSEAAAAGPSARCKATFSFEN